MGLKHLFKIYTIQSHLKFQATARVLLPLLCLLLAAGGCAPKISHSPASLGGSFSGHTEAGEPLTLFLHQKENKITGYGNIGPRAFSLASLTSWHGPANFIFEDGKKFNGYLKFTPDGNRSEISISGEKVLTSRNNDTINLSPGTFSGNYFTQGPLPIRLRLTQNDMLIAGSGFAGDKPIAVVGKQIASDKAKGSVLFSDESRTILVITISEAGDELTVQGIGSPFIMRRQ